MFAARLTVHVRDLTQILPFVNRILFYTSGVLFAVDRIFAAHPWVVRLYDFHPLYQVLQIARSFVPGGLGGHLQYEIDDVVEPGGGVGQ